MDKEIKFCIPGFYEYEKTNKVLIDLLEEYQEYFYDNIKINAIYGCFPGNIWNGGRSIFGYTDLNEAEKIINDFNDRRIPIRFTWTNLFLKSYHYEDEICNTLMEFADNGMNEVIIAENNLEKYIKDIYPNFKIISEYYSSLDNENYYLTTLDPRLNHNFDFLENIKNKNKIELLVNPSCNKNCPNIEAHCAWESKNQLFNVVVDPPEDFNLDFYCSDYDFFDFQDKEIIFVNELYNIYNDMGFNNFKLEGRTIDIFDIIENYIYFFVKPQFKDKVRNILLKRSF